MRHHWLRRSILALCFVAAAVTGYWVSAEFGAEALRREAQEQLSSVMKGSVRIARARLVIRGGLFLEGDRVGVYPRETVPRSPALFASRVSAEIDVLALLTGRFRLNGLLLDDAVLEIHRDASGRWSPPPFQWLVDRERRGGAAGPDMERSLDWVHGLEVVTRTLLESPLVARRIELRRSRITWYDESTHVGGEPVRVGLYQVEGRLVHHWLSGDAELRLRAALVGSDGRAVPLTAEGWQRGGDEMRLAVTASRLPLAYLEPYVFPDDAGERLEGAWSGQLAYERHARAHGTVTLESAIEDFEATLSVPDGRFEIARPLVQVSAALEAHPGRVRLAHGRIDAEGIVIALAGSVERPLGPAARARLDVGIGGLDLAEVRRIVHSLPDADAETLESVLARVHDGRIERIGARGTARLDQWGPLLVGDADRLPRGFVLSASVADVEVRAGDDGRLSAMGGVLEVSGDRLRLRDATGLWNGEPLPRLAVSIHGVSHLFAGGDAPADRIGHARAMPGLGALAAILRGRPDDDDDREEAAPRIRLEIDRLDHPILRWPVTDALVAVERAGPTTRLVFERGLWAGAPFEGDAVWMSGATDELVVGVRVAAPAGAAAATGTERPGPEPDDGTWAAGRFEIDDLDADRWPVGTLRGRFRVAGARLGLDDLHARLLPTGQIEAKLDVDLDRSEEVDVALDFRIEGGDAGRLGRVIGMPAGYATGSLSLSGRLEGPVRPQTPLLASLTGQAHLEVQSGELRRDELPLVIALAQASAGYNDFAARDAIAFDSVRAGLVFADGRVTSQNFVLDGPLRVYASGTIDTVRPPHEMVAVVGLFLFRTAGQIMESIPLVKAILPGSEKGLMGAYFRVSGPFDDPNVDALAGRSVEEDLPDVITAPYQLLRSLLGGRSRKKSDPGDAPATGEPPVPAAVP